MDSGPTLQEPTAARRSREYGSGYIFRRGAFYWCQFHQDGQRVRISTCETDPDAARKFLRNKIKESHAGKFKLEERSLRYEHLRTALLNDYVANGHKSLRYRDGKPSLEIGHLDRFFAGAKVSQIKTTALRRFVLQLQAEGLKPGTINRQLAALRRMFTIAQKDGRLASMPYFPMLSEKGNARRGFLEYPQYRTLLNELPDYLRPVLALGFFGGMRRAEILALKWSNVDFKKRTITLHAGETKNDEPRTIPILAELAGILSTRQRKDFQFVNWRLDDDGRPVQLASFRKAWEKACVAAALGKFEPAVDDSGAAVVQKRCDRPKGKAKPKMFYRGLILHDLRRSAVRNLVDCGVPERTAMVITGHKTRSVFDRYDIRGAKDAALAGEKLAAYFAENSHNLATNTDSAPKQKAVIQ